MTYKMMKVFDCQKMPKHIKDAFFDCEEKGNDCAVRWECELGDHMIPESLIVSNWLIDNGAQENEVVMIEHWW